MAKKKISEQELIQNNLASHLEKLRQSYINEPTVFYNVGDRVQRGHIKQTNITEVIDNGKIYKVHEICTENNYGNPYERDDYVAWMDVTPYRTLEENRNLPTLTEKYSVQINYQQRSIMGLFSIYYYFGLDMSPNYQRGNVWGLEDKVKLIDSIFKNIDIGKFVIIYKPYKENDTGYEVLDGKQRINAIIEFYENRFQYKGKFFKDLSYGDQQHFEDYPVAYGDVSEITQKQKYEYFLKLNVGGKVQDPEHIKYVQNLYDKENK